MEEWLDKLLNDPAAVAAILAAFVTAIGGIIVAFIALRKPKTSKDPPPAVTTNVDGSGTGIAVGEASGPIAGHTVIQAETVNITRQEAPKSDEQPVGPPAPIAFDGSPVSVARLPVTGEHLFGREEELAALDAAWGDPNVNVISIVAPGGVGKSALVNRWLDGMRADGWRGAERVYGWSFYSQGAAQDRAASADAFVGETLAAFGDPEPEEGTPYQKGERLARLVKGARMLLVLDGMEPLQDPVTGRITDPALQTLVRELEMDNPGLCIVTTRQPVEDLAGPDAARSLDLELLGDDDGAEYLHELGVKGSDGERRAASTEFGGHALALKLLGGYLAEVHAGDVTQRGEVSLLEEDAEQGGHAWRVLRSHEARLSDVETAVLRLVGLFDRPAEPVAVAALREPPVIADLTDTLEGVGKATWARALSRLRGAGLLAADEAGSGGLDAHPLVREYFATRLRDDLPEAWRAGNGRLYEHYRDTADEFPETREGMEPLFAAVGHGCRAGRYQEALDDVLDGRIDRGDEAFGVKKLGLFGSHLAALAGFFDPPFSTPVADLPASDRSYLLNDAGFCLLAQGRLADAVAPTAAGLEMHIDREDWQNAARAAGNLSELHLALGDVPAAVDAGAQAVEFADRSGDGFLREFLRTIHAAALAQAGGGDAVQALFEAAEAMQQERQPNYRYLPSLQGYRYCDLLLDRGRAAAVRERAETTLEWAQEHFGLLDVALDRLSLGRAPGRGGGRLAGLR